jgi:hypothetical protein
MMAKYRHMLGLVNQQIVCGFCFLWFYCCVVVSAENIDRLVNILLESSSFDWRILWRGVVN